MPVLPVRPLATMTELNALLLVRNPVLRAGHTLNIGRTSNLEAYLGQFIGEIHDDDDECRHCTRGSGPWVGYVTVDTLLSGSCYNCHYNNEGPRCSLRKFRPVSVLL